MSYKGDAFIITSLIMTVAQNEASIDEASDAIAYTTRRVFSSDVAAEDFVKAVHDKVREGVLTKDTPFIEALGIIGPIVEEYKCY